MGPEIECPKHGTQPAGEDYTCPRCWSEIEHENVCDLCGYEYPCQCEVNDG